MNAAILNDTTVSPLARFVMLWICRNPSEAINPDAIASANHMPVKTVKSLLAELAGHVRAYLIKPERVQGQGGRFEWTPYTLNPSYGQPSHGEPSHGKLVDGHDAARAETPSDQKPHMDTGDDGQNTPVEYVRGDAREEKEFVKETKEIDVVNPTNSLTVIDTSAGGQVVASKDIAPTRFDPDMPGVEPEVKAALPALLAKAQPQTRTLQSAPIPNSAAPLPPSVLDAYFAFARRGATPDEKETVVLRELITARGVDVVTAQLKACPERDSGQNEIRNPAAYIRTFEPKSGRPSARQNNYRARSHRDADDYPQSNAYPDDMEFEPPTPKLAHSPIGVTA